MEVKPLRGYKIEKITIIYKPIKKAQKKEANHNKEIVSPLLFPSILKRKAEKGKRRKKCLKITAN